MGNARCGPNMQPLALVDDGDPQDTNGEIAMSDYPEAGGRRTREPSPAGSRVPRCPSSVIRQRAKVSTPQLQQLYENTHIDG
jgi:hypothetical protein